MKSQIDWNNFEFMSCLCYRCLGYIPTCIFALNIAALYYLDRLRSKTHKTRQVVYHSEGFEEWNDKILGFFPKFRENKLRVADEIILHRDSAVCEMMFYQPNLKKECFKDNNDIFVSILCTDGRGMLIIVLLEYCTSIRRI